MQCQEGLFDFQSVLKHFSLASVLKATACDQKLPHKNKDVCRRKSPIDAMAEQACWLDWQLLAKMSKTISLNRAAGGTHSGPYLNSDIPASKRLTMPAVVDE